VGPSGIGKTQLALELAYRTRQEHKNCLVFWIPACDMESLHNTYIQIAQRLNIPGREDKKTDIKKLVQLHLSRKSAGQWLLVFDNADEGGLETAGSSKAARFVEYLPSSKQGVIVLITTDRKAAVTLASQHIVDLPGLEQDTAQRLLQMCLISPATEQDAEILFHRLEYIPLAIVQAAAYINVNNITLKDYLPLLAKQKKEIVEIIREETDDGWLLYNTENPVATTWLISFDQIHSHDVLAADYLFFMACIDRKDIPLALLPTAAPREAMDALEILNAYSFITKRPAESALDLHRSVHLAIRHWLQKQGLLSKWTQIAVERLLEVFPDHNHGNRSKWRRLLPHAKYALSSGITGEVNEARHELVWKCAMTLASDGRYNEAEPYFHEAVRIFKSAMGEEHPDTLTSMAVLATTYVNQGRWKEAEELAFRVVETRQRVLGEEHLDTVAGIASLASTYRSQGRWEEAEKLELRVMELRKQVLGEEHPHTLVSMANLASTLLKQGRWKETEELFTRVMETNLKVLGEEHPSTLTSIANLASTYREQGQWNKAEELLVRVMETELRVLGEEHPGTLASTSNLAGTYRAQGRWEEAEELDTRVMETSLRVRGETHPVTLVSMNNLAATMSNQGRWKEAEKLELRVMEMRKKILGEEHPDTLMSIANLALTYWNQCRWKEAEELQVQITERSLSVLGEEHPFTITSLGNLAATFLDQGRMKEAGELEVRVMEIRERVLGEDHPDTLTSVANLAVTYWKQDRLTDAEELGMRVLETRKRLLGEEHPQTLTSMNNLARIWKSCGRDTDALELITKCLQILKSTLGNSHPNTLRCSATVKEWISK
jgi:tetratricopeptide (TPR) repeat protein